MIVPMLDSFWELVKNYMVSNVKWSSDLAPPTAESGFHKDLRQLHINERDHDLPQWLGLSNFIVYL